MNSSDLITNLLLPGSARVDQRVPKKLLLENGAPTPVDKRLINDGVEEIHWLATLKPSTVGVPEYHDETREYLEIAVLTVTLREAAKASRLIELIHRAIPYPLLLITVQADSLCLSLAHKRWSQGESGKVVIEEIRQSTAFPASGPTTEQSAFLASLALASLPRSDLFALYQGWIDRLTSLEAAHITGKFSVPDSIDSSATMRAGLDARNKLNADISQLRAQAAKEKQLNHRVALNLRIKEMEAELASVISALKQGKT